MNRIAVAGSLNDDIVVRAARFPRPGETLTAHALAHFPGGKGGNQAFAAARVGDPARVQVAMLGQVGGDAAGTWLREGLASAGVDVTGVLRDPGQPSGTALITLDDAGQNQILIVAGSNGSFTPERLDTCASILASARLLLVQLEIPLATVERAIARARATGAAVMLDPAPARPLPDELLRAVDYLTPNESELRALLGEPPADRPLTRAEALAGARALQARGARQVLVKLGGAGALLVPAMDTGAADPRFFPAFAVQVVDTTAAGDAFNAAFAVALVEGRPLDEAGRFACAVAALSVSRAGAQPSIPTREETLALLRAG